MSNQSLIDRYPCLESVFMDRGAIASRVAALAEVMCRDYGDCERLCLMVILKGACFFACDLIRALQEAGMNDIRVEFIRASTYGNGMKNTDDAERVVRIESMTGAVVGEHVLLVDDVLDQGFTLSALKRHLLTAAGAASVRTAVFLAKDLEQPSPAVQALRASFRVDYVGVRAPDRWLVGYGLDVGGRFRELPFIAIAREECFR